MSGKRITMSLALALATTLAACGGGNPLDNPPLVDNALADGSQLLSFAYFQRCIQPIFTTPLPVLDGSGATNTCASAGCHQDGRSTGGALALDPSATLQDGATPAATVRASAMYRNYLSARSTAIPGAALQSNLLRKPLVLNLLHGGGQVFANTDSVQAQRIAYWIAHPLPEGQDEFSPSADALFNPPDSASGACNPS